MSARPGTGGTTGSEPVATTTCSAVWGTPSTSTTPTPASRPVPRSRSMPLSASQRCLAGIGVVRDHEISIGQSRLHIDLGAGRRFACLLGRLAGAQQRLGGDARPVGALAAGQLAFDDGDPQPTVGQLPGAVLARRAGAQDDDVVAAHVVVPAPAWSEGPDCSSTMYCAYQSGQSGSACPISCSWRP